MPLPLKVFLSYSPTDKDAVQELCQKLSEYSIDVWTDEKILPGQEWEIATSKALQNADAVVVCLTKKSIMAEGGLQKQITFALDFAKEKPENTIYIIPVKLQQCKLPERLNKYRSASLFEINGFDSLIQSLQTRAKLLRRSFEIPISTNQFTLLNLDELRKYDVPLTEIDALRFFNGRDPKWKESISPSVARREVVNEIKEAILLEDMPNPYIVLVKGLSGEGKSTALQQTIYEVLKERQDIKILWHKDIKSSIGFRERVEKIANSSEEWIIASDEAQNLINDLVSLENFFLEEEVENIRFLLAMNESEWERLKRNWNKNHSEALLLQSEIKEINVSNFTKTDAYNIVEKWGKYGEKGLGSKLNSIDITDASKELYQIAKNEKIGTSLLGAMLQIRTGKTLSEHLRPNLNKLEEKKVVEIQPGGFSPENFSLGSAMAYISVLHSYNIKLLNRDILAGALECSKDILEKKVIIDLGEEIVDDDTILIRHSAIAKATKTILQESYGNLLYTFAKDLIRSAIITLAHKPEINYWLAIPKLIFEQGDTKMGIALAEEIVETYLSENGKFRYDRINELTTLLRNDKQVKKATKTHREKYSNSEISRSYYYAWSVAEGECQHHYLSAWLAGISLADGDYEDNKDKKRIFKSFSGLAEAFDYLYDKNSITESNKQIFLNACFASANLALKENKDFRLSQIQSNAQQAGAKLSANELTLIKEGIKLAYLLRQENFQNNEEFGHFPQGVPEFDVLRFTWLENEMRELKK